MAARFSGTLKSVSASFLNSPLSMFLFSHACCREKRAGDSLLAHLLELPEPRASPKPLEALEIIDGVPSVGGGTSHARWDESVEPWRRLFPLECNLDDAIPPSIRDGV